MSQKACKTDDRGTMKDGYPPSDMNQALEIKHQGLRCSLAPALGGAVAGLWLDGVPVLRSTEARDLANVHLSGSFPLLPFSNRIGRGRMHWAGQDYTLALNVEPHPHAIHGVAWQRPWSVLQADDSSAVLGYTHSPDENWPFAFEARQAFRLDDEGLHLDISLRNLAPQAVPAGLGWHPYFPKRAGCHIAFSATGRWEPGPDKLPTHCSNSVGLETTCAELVIDHCFEGWSGEATLVDENLRTHLRANLEHLVVYTHPGLAAVAIEPVSHVNNAIQQPDPLALGLRVLQPGQTMGAQIHIHAEHNP